MSRQNFGQIAALEYLDWPGMDFPDIVEEFDIALHKLAAQVRSLTWDGEDIALIDRETTRIALGWLPPASDEAPHYLVIAVGPLGESQNIPNTTEAYRALLDLLVERVECYLPCDAALHGEAYQPVGSALIDHTFDLLTARPGLGLSSTERAERRKSAKPGARRRGARATPRTDDFHQTVWEGSTRTQETPPRPEAPAASVPMRLTIITLGLTLFLHVPPIGAALLTYTTLREATPLLIS